MAIMLFRLLIIPQLVSAADLCQLKLLVREGGGDFKMCMLAKRCISNLPLPPPSRYLKILEQCYVFKF